MVNFGNNVGLERSSGFCSTLPSWRATEGAIGERAPPAEWPYCSNKLHHQHFDISPRILSHKWSLRLKNGHTTQTLVFSGGAIVDKHLINMFINIYNIGLVRPLVDIFRCISKMVTQDRHWFFSGGDKWLVTNVHAEWMQLSVTLLVEFTVSFINMHISHWTC